MAFNYLTTLRWSRFFPFRSWWQDYLKSISIKWVWMKRARALLKRHLTKAYLWFVNKTHFDAKNIISNWRKMRRIKDQWNYEFWMEDKIARCFARQTEYTQSRKKKKNKKCMVRRVRLNQGFFPEIIGFGNLIGSFDVRLNCFATPYSVWL